MTDVALLNRLTAPLSLKYDAMQKRLDPAPDRQRPLARSLAFIYKRTAHRQWRRRLLGAAVIHVPGESDLRNGKTC